MSRKGGWVRTSGVTNRADPTAWTKWENRFITLIASWGVEAKVRLFGRTWRTYDHWFFKWLFERLEDTEVDWLKDDPYEEIYGRNV